MSNNEYKKMMEQIEVPETLKKETLQKMKEEKAVKRKPSSKYIFMAASAAAAILILIGVSRLYYPGEPGADVQIADENSDDSFIRTPVSESEHTEYVELADGYLDFYAGEDSLSGEYNFGQINPLQREWTVEEFEGYTGVNVEIPYVPEGFLPIDAAVKAEYDYDENVVSAVCNLEYKKGEGQSLNFMISDKAIATEETYSYNKESRIGETSLFLGYDSKEDLYYGKVELNSLYWVISGKGMTQEEYIKVIYELLK